MNSSMSSVLPAIMPGMKLYVVTRQDLSPGAQATQSCHALFQFACEYPLVGQTWFENSNTLALLVTRDEVELQRLFKKAKELDIRCSAFHEPDMKNQLTAIALEPGPKTRRLVARLPLTLGER